MTIIKPSAGQCSALRDRREGLGWTIEDLASRAGVSWRTIWAAETGYHRPRRATLYVIALALGCKTEDLDVGE